MSSTGVKVGFWWSEKKAQKLSLEEFSRLLAEKGLTPVKLDLDAPLDPQGPFALIVHKLSDVAAKADGGDVVAKKQVDAFEDYVRRHSDVIVLDRMEGVRILMDRYRQYKLIDDSDLAREDVVFTPPFVELLSTDISENMSRLREAGVKFPLVCKPLMAHGSTFAHQMSLIFCEDGLREIKPPCVAQTFINHNARLFKLFVIKDKYNVIERPSLKNFRSGEFETVYFDSHDISKPYSSSALTELDDSDENSAPPEDPCKEHLDRIVKVVRGSLDVALFGIDVIIEKGTGRYAIIDMNLFPGYDGVDNFLEVLRDLILEEIEGKVASSKIVPPSSHFEPSVVEVPDNSANLGKTSTDEVPSLASSVIQVRYHIPEF